MEIVHLSTVHPRYDTRIFVKECSTLFDSGNSVTLILADGKGDDVRNGVVIKDVCKDSSRLKRASLSAFRVYKKAVEMNADIYHFHDPELIWVGLLLKLKGHIVIYDVHEDVPQQILRKYWIPKVVAYPLSFVFSCVERFATKFFDGVVTVTPTLVARFSKRNVVEICNFPKLEEFSTANRKDKLPGSPIKIVYVGAISKERGIIEMLDALSHIESDFEFHLVGPFISKDLELSAKSHPNWKAVKFYGWQGREEISELLSTTDIGLVVLQPTGDYEKAYPVKLFEYLASGNAVIASKFPLWEELVDKAKGGVCVNPQNPLEIARAIDDLANDSGALRSMQKSGPVNVAKYFSWDGEAKKLIMFYKSIFKDIELGNKE
ncbi:glycosyltransferase family 4 protein [Pseudoalteromonas sp. YIC-656]|uniref:glycosyltransferase family 4 protein n=1 Tax=Pseudoalteromonas pernae TaxID=3118054 RepID=UPI003242A390